MFMVYMCLVDEWRTFCVAGPIPADWPMRCNESILIVPGTLTEA
jgi:hypothetical protein